MARPIHEADWKHFRQVRTIARERFCRRVLDEIGRLASDTSKGTHERYLEIHELMERRDKELGTAFDNPRRSMALRQLMCLHAHDLLIPEEMARFSAETRDAVQILGTARRALEDADFPE